MLNVNKPNKVRVVFDAAAKFDGTSLNDRLYHGPDLTNNLVGVLIRFREEETAFIADVEAMFHQVKVLPEDADGQLVSVFSVVLFSGFSCHFRVYSFIVVLSCFLYFSC